MEFDVRNKCRVCLNEEIEMHNLFDEIDSGLRLMEIFTSTTSFHIDENSQLSPYLCQNCTTIIVDFYNLKIIYTENENRLKMLFNNVKDEYSETELSIKSDENVETINNNNNNNDDDDDDEGEDESVEAIKVEIYSGSEDSEDDNEDNPAVKGKESVIFQEHDSNILNIEDTELENYICIKCEINFGNNKAELQEHLHLKHQMDCTTIETFYKEDEITNKKCKICGEIVSSEEYKDHLILHRNNFCDICGTGFLKKSYLRDHREVHATEKKHVCNFCNKAFKRRTVLVKHKRIHTNPRECICEVCGAAFNDKGTLKTHIMLKHIKIRNFVCTICGIKFPLKSTLEKHLKRHENKAREFFCPHCPLGYKDKSSLGRHIYIKHSGVNTKVCCEDCGKQYSTVSNMLKHRRISHELQSSVFLKVEKSEKK